MQGVASIMRITEFYNEWNLGLYIVTQSSERRAYFFIFKSIKRSEEDILSGTLQHAWRQALRSIETLTP